MDERGTVAFLLSLGKVWALSGPQEVSGAAAAGEMEVRAGARAGLDLHHPSSCPAQKEMCPEPGRGRGSVTWGLL